ncbi:MAG: ABC transporter permease subunit [Bacilli bacterium]|nr:ABC transporter permease subunit [Bacilli bacterium]
MNKKLYSLNKNEVTYVKEDFEKISINEREVENSIQIKSSFFKDCFKAFAKNKASLIAAIVLSIIALFAIITPIASPFTKIDSLSYNIDGSRLSNIHPKNLMFEGSGFWDGTYEKKINDADYYVYKFYDTENKPIIKDNGEIKDVEMEMLNASQKIHSVTLDSYAVGSSYISLNKEDYFKLEEYCNNTGKNIIQDYVDYRSYIEEYRNELLASEFNYSQAMIDITIKNMEIQYRNANITYKIVPLLNTDGSIRNNNVFLPMFDNTDVVHIYSSSVIDNDRHIKGVIENGQYHIRVDYMPYFEYKYGFSPIFLFGSNSAGQDLLSRLAIGTLFSLGLGILVTAINLLIGLVYGAVEGYYGGKTDLILERVSDILSAIPSIILLVIFNVYFSSIPGLNQGIAVVLGLFIAFILTGWIGVAGTTRMQFYRYKGLDFVAASRSLGAKNSRLIFKHILPNAIGTIITSSILMIPGVIFSESSLSYLGIIDFSGSGLSSIGQLLNEGSGSLGSDNAYLLLFPTILISLLMISFNLFGNGLRDAFNPLSRGE